VGHKNVRMHGCTSHVTEAVGARIAEIFSHIQRLSLSMKLANRISLLICLVACAAPQGVRAGALAYAPPAPTSEVAVIKLDWHDATRDRDVPVKIYLPKNGGGPFPVVIFSHGLGGSREGYEYLGRHWAGCGYVSVHLQHPGSDDSIWKGVPAGERAKALQKGAGNIANALNRPLDGQFAIDQIEKLNADETSPLKGRLNLKAVGFAGHSFGGYTTLALAGETFILPAGTTKRYDEPRIKAAIQMSAPAPKIRRQLDETFNTITIPLMHMTGTKDFLEILPQTTAVDRRIPFDHMGSSETCLVTFNGGDHFIFSGRERMSAAPEKLAQDAAFQKLITAGTTAFWDAYLKDNAEARKWLLAGGYAKMLGELATFESKAPTPQPK
jgi:predicted dienelactone hydrolase